MINKFWLSIKANKGNILLATILFFISILLGYYFVDEKSPLIQSILAELQNIVQNIKGRNTIIYMIYTIFVNNTLTAIKMIVFGIFFGLFPIIALLGNGVLIGFFLKHMALTGGGISLFLIGILPHGIIEIPAIIIAASFGMKLGFSFLKTITQYLNKNSRVNNAPNLKETIKQIPIIILGLSVMLFIAAIIESTITGYLLTFFSN